MILDFSKQYSLDEFKQITHCPICNFSLPIVSGSFGTRASYSLDCPTLKYTKWKSSHCIFQLWIGNLIRLLIYLPNSSLIEFTQNKLFLHTNGFMVNAPPIAENINSLTFTQIKQLYEQYSILS